RVRSTRASKDRCLTGPSRLAPLALQDDGETSQLLLPPLRHLGAFLARFRQADGDRLLLAPDLAAAAALERAFLALPHRALDVLRRLLRIFASHACLR